MQRFLFLPFFLLLFHAFAGAGHPFYVSVIEIDHAPEQHALQLTIKIFTDDLENTLENAGAPEISLGTKEEHEETDRYLADYLEQHLKLKMNGEPVDLVFLGKEVEMQKTRCYVEVKGIPEKIEELEVYCDLLTEMFDTQSNIVHTRIHGQDKSEKLDRGYRKEIFTY